MATKEVFDLTNRIKMDIVGERTRPTAPERTSAEIVRIRP
jgi:NitT/TauT family transport system ATP-binding protein